MNDLVGIIRTADEVERGARAGSRSSRRARKNVTVEGHRQFNPGWHLALDLRNMLIVSECVAKAALHPRGVARRPHPRRLPGDEPGVAQGQPGLLAPTATASTVEQQPLPVMPTELLVAVRPRRAEQVHDRRGAGRLLPEGNA